MKTTEKFGWVNEKGGNSPLQFDSMTDAARDGINKNPKSFDYVYVVSSTRPRPYVGMAVGINFHS